MARAIFAGIIGTVVVTELDVLVVDTVVDVVDVLFGMGKFTTPTVVGVEVVDTEVVVIDVVVEIVDVLVDVVDVLVDVVDVVVEDVVDVVVEVLVDVVDVLVDVVEVDVDVVCEMDVYVATSVTFP